MKNNIEYIMDWFQNHVWLRPKPSTICDGIGMFAIRDIPKGTSVYDLAKKNCCEWIPFEVANTLPRGVFDWIIESQPHVGSEVCDDDFTWKEENGPVWIYTAQNLNWQTNWFFQNHSTTPNVKMKTTKNPRMFEYYTMRDIKEGEELLEDYDDYVGTWKGK